MPVTEFSPNRLMRPAPTAPCRPRLLLVLLFGYALSWIFATVGLIVGDPETAQAAAFPVMAPLVFASKTPIPADAVTGSASGIDPHISPRNAEIQAARVAKTRGVSPEQIQSVVDAHTEGRTWGLLGEPRVNVLELNLDLDQRFPRK